MKIFESIAGLQAHLDLLRGEGKVVGLVPTMGALHEGHIQLIKESISRCEITVCSIFVNPTQFNNPDDLLKYPNQLEKDEQMLLDAGCDIVFVPSVQEMYPEKNESLTINFGFLETVLEGAFRQGHFSGVGTVVSKLLNIVQPDLSFFGQKDLQQLAVIKKLTNDLNIRTKIISIPTVRESSGLAMSSRNQRLTNEQKVLAAKLYQTMEKLKTRIISGTPITEALDLAKKGLLEHREIELEYLEVVNSDSMVTVVEMSKVENISICIAAHIGGVRLIDNLYLKQED
ncbi:pantoate--beta-alanine ligase [Reichenbachiella faecimaris]|uniref:Pantothenate synthetase n=1 Tax=Reichenbachiella faecimaris TaxID=692418 RepID=A0A1W2GBW6_REIFA|nr:pantoate--beta-alanine ligase [Reichenbachiella faecimaris]SMD34004.1 pantoate--beta-alanine ligase [Reichenbachiella faecimaris]